MPQQQQGIAPYGQGQLPMAGTLQSEGAGPGPSKRNALMTFLVPLIVIVGSVIVGTVLAIILGMISPGLAIVGRLILLAGYIAGVVMFILSAIKMVNELKVVTRNAAFP